MLGGKTVLIQGILILPHNALSCIIRATVTHKPDRTRSEQTAAVYGMFDLDDFTSVSFFFFFKVSRTFFEIKSWKILNKIQYLLGFYRRYMVIITDRLTALMKL